MVTSSILLRASLLVLSISANSLIGPADNSASASVEEDPIGFFNTNQKELHRTYAETFDKEWAFGRAIDKKTILNSDRSFYGWVVKFDRGYFAFDSHYGFLESDEEVSPYLWDESTTHFHLYGAVGTWNNEVFYSLKGERLFDSDVAAYSNGNYVDFYPITNTPSFNQFKIRNVWCNFDYFHNVLGYQFNDSQKWQALCIDQNNQNKRVCMIAAAVDLLFTYKLSTKHDCTEGKSPDSLYDAIASGVQTGDKGANAVTFTIDVNKYLNKTNTGCYLNAASNPFGPYIGNYHYHGDVLYGHTVVVIGEGSSVYWGPFHTYWDIVVTWVKNYNQNTYQVELNNTDSLDIPANKG